MTRTFAWLAGAAVFLLIAGTAAYAVLLRPDNRFAQCGDTSVATGGQPLGGPFELTRHDGVRVTDTDVIDGLTLVYFGYTFCPDVCPIDTGRNADATALVVEQGVTVKPVLISVDPGRDTPEVLADYTSWMHPRMVGLTGSEEEIADAARGYRAYYDVGSGEDYLVAHSTFTYLMAPEHGFLTFFNRDATTEEMAEKIACYDAVI
mgnify:CR=1 FL=1